MKTMNHPTASSLITSISDSFVCKQHFVSHPFPVAIRQGIGFLLVVLSLLTPVEAQRKKPAPTIEKILGDSITVIAREYMYSDTIRRVKITVEKNTKKVLVTANDDFGHLPFRRRNVDQIYQLLHRRLAHLYPGYEITAMAYNRDIRHLIPNYLRKTPYENRFYRQPKASMPAVTRLDRGFEITDGLTNRHIAVWNSHGIHNLNNDTTWGWQRPNLFQTVEDLLTTSFVLPFLAPMLENAGAQVYIPRERDINPHEVIVDNDGAANSRYREYNDRLSWKKASPGFANYRSWYTYPENPFDSGTYVINRTLTDPFESSRIEWIPDIPVEAEYAVYVSYRTVENSTKDARYSVHHAGGVTRFSVNQQMNGKTWLYLGHFKFKKGRKSQGKVVLTNLSSTGGGIITADAVKFGGGMGTITGIRPVQVRDTKVVPAISGYPRFAEGARYWLQWAGAPDSVYSRTQNTNHYSDDFQSRGYWVNYLREGLRVPIDLAFAFHTDAGTRPGDSIIGTLGIATVNNNLGDTLYSNGVSRWAGRDMVDLIQTEIVNDIRQGFRSDWTRRGIWNRSYSESRVPDVPTMLLELLSHQNFEDMKYALDPRFRFTVSRAIYKGMLKYFSAIDNTPYVVQPLPVHYFSSRFGAHNKVVLKWEFTPDLLEISATPTSYKVYTRINDGGFDNGKHCESDSIELTVEPGTLYSFKITAVNSGGESFPSEILSVYRDPHEKGELLIINGFTRISGPEHFQLGTMAGFLNDKDAGVPYLYDLNFTGRQHDFSTSSVYITQSRPGFGASERTHDNVTIEGNRFDYPALHGRSVMEAGYSFVSTSVDAVRAGHIPLKHYRMIDFIGGKQKQTILGNVKKTPEFQTFPLDLQRLLTLYSRGGGNLLVSGAYIASDMYNDTDSASQQFLKEVLHVKPGKADQARFGQVRIESPADTGLKLQGVLNYQTAPNREIYFVEEADILIPVGDNAHAVGWYNGSEHVAMVASRREGKTLVMGYPFELITDEDQRNKLMQRILNYMFKQ